MRANLCVKTFYNFVCTHLRTVSIHEAVAMHRQEIRLLRKLPTRSEGTQLLTATPGIYTVEYSVAASAASISVRLITLHGNGVPAE